MTMIANFLRFLAKKGTGGYCAAIVQMPPQPQDFSCSLWDAKHTDKSERNTAQEFVHWCLTLWLKWLENLLNLRGDQFAWIHIFISFKCSLGFLASKAKKGFLLFILASFMHLHAPIGQDLMTFFKSAGMASNVTAPGAYRDQSAGYYTGGSIMARTGARNAQLATVQMPGFRAGCGGIDAWTGGFSHISTGAIVEMMRNIGSSAASYAFMLAVQTVSPQIYNIMNELNALATQINQTNINSCEAAATMLGGIWPKSDQSSKYLCQAMGSNLGAFTDWSAARQGCGAKGDRDSVLSRAGADPKYKDMLVGEFNLAWKAIQTLLNLGGLDYCA
jgi:hypothetical protein